MSDQTNIKQQLQQQILQMQGWKAVITSERTTNLGPIAKAFPNAVFPNAGLHQFLCCSPHHSAASAAFVCGLLKNASPKSGAVLWVGSDKLVFPPALRHFELQPEQILFHQNRREKDRIWVVEEALKSEGLGAVIGELSNLDFTLSRRLQLAIEKSAVPCYVLQQKPTQGPAAITARWLVTPLASKLDNDLPGVGHLRWRVELLKVRNGSTGVWNIEWRKGKLHYASPFSIIGGKAQQSKTA